ncbi:sugar phosphate isomerase/epimerase family protein [Metabacillus halosaccharovorans]|uniref:Sugar phosphate isomerase/epimerase n=1 Tax=Metabacillus halosaccharovorans TaxID=930124 RepID=A0ABT3DF31_9BACI|nr:sugar phosphate isomerase/epimerase family protein [Metabacillus halosaccharovorans]MCV9885141.1 sugar phosphate isomerase/epimerase [Metabacillus halosaccharovorans]
MKYAVQDKLLHSSGYLETFKRAEQLNFDGVEITAIGGALNEEITKEIITASNQTGLVPSAICGGYRNWIGDFNKEKRLEAVEDIGISLRFAKEMGAGGVIAPAAYGMFSKKLPPFQPPRDEQGDKGDLLDSLNRIVEHAERYNINLFVEPLNRYEDHMMNTVEQAVALMKEVGSDRLKVMADFFHMSIEEENIDQTISEYANFIGYYHLADSNRYQPGKGHTDFQSYIKSIQQTKYQGYLSFECGLKGDVYEALQVSLAYLKSLETVIN